MRILSYTTSMVMILLLALPLSACQDAVVEKVPVSQQGQHTDAVVGSANSKLTTTPQVLRGPEIHLTAEVSNLDPGNGKKIPVWTYNNSVPGPQIRMKKGDTIRIILTNKLPEATSIHWHGMKVPNDQDGVPGVTQLAIHPGETYTYEFKATQTGTYWYHSHENSVVQEDMGLYGSFVVEDPGQQPDRDYTLVLDEWYGANNLYTINGKTGDATDPLTVKEGDKVRIRMINAGMQSHSMHLHGHAFRVVATDGQVVNRPGLIKDQLVSIAPGERVDLEFTADHPGEWLLEEHGQGDIAKGMRTKIVYDGAKAGTDSSDLAASLPEFDYTKYGEPAISPFHLSDAFDKEYTMKLGTMEKDGQVMYTINDQVYPDIPDLMVKEGDKVKVKLINVSKSDDHPMHLHGHLFQVLEKNGVPLSRSPIMKDTVNLHPGEEATVAFEADNTGIWMFHCHILTHAAAGMMTDMKYEGFHSKFMSDSGGHHGHE